MILIPLAVGLDNALTGGSLYDLTSRVTSDMNWIWVYVGFSGCVLLGQFMGTGVQLIYEYLVEVRYKESAFVLGLGLSIKYSLVLGLGLSFLEASLEFLRNGFSVWVGIGATIAWLLTWAETTMDEPQATHVKYSGVFSQ